MYVMNYAIPICFERYYLCYESVADIYVMSMHVSHALTTIFEVNSSCSLGVSFSYFFLYGRNWHVLIEIKESNNISRTID